MSKAVAKKGTTALAKATSFEEATKGMGSGRENVTSADLLIPRLTILQGLSPQVTQGKSEYDKSASVGQIWDVGLAEGFDGPVVFIPVHYVKQYRQRSVRHPR